MLNNKTKDMTPFDMKKVPVKQYPFLMPLLWGGSWVMTRQFGLKISKVNMEGIKPPFLVYSTHQGFSDYYIAPLALFPHRANYVSDMEGFAAFGEWLYRGIGCIGKRRYVPDITVVKNIKYALDKGQSVVVFPESRHSNVGTTAYLPKNLGRLAKLMEVPVVTLSVHGSYLAGPVWDEEHTRKVPMEATLECICSKDELAAMDESVLQQRIEEKLQYDEYAWQEEQQIRISYPKRAEGLHKALYRCRNCDAQYAMAGEGSRLYCKKCKAEWKMDEYGKLCGVQGERIHIPDWYEWERRLAKEELNQMVPDKHGKTFDVRVEALPNAKGFVPLGEGKLFLDAEAFRLTLSNKEMVFSHKNRESLQTEYNYRGRGSCIVLSDRDCCYYIYSEDESFQPTELQFLAEAFYQRK